MPYIATAPLVLAKNLEGKVQYYYEDTLIPWLSDEQAEHFERLGLVEKVANSTVAVELQVPKKTAAQTDWVAYAVNVHGADPVEASKLSKQDLIELYGG